MGCGFANIHVFPLLSPDFQLPAIVQCREGWRVCGSVCACPSACPCSDRHTGANTSEQEKQVCRRVRASEAFSWEAPSAPGLIHLAKTESKEIHSHVIQGDAVRLVLHTSCVLTTLGWLVPDTGDTIYCSGSAKAP